jgi:uncharacterized membrane protein
MTLLLRHLPFLLAAAGAVGFASSLWLASDVAITIAADVFFAVFLILTLNRVTKLTKSYLRRHAGSSDVPVWLIFLSRSERWPPQWSRCSS